MRIGQSRYGRLVSHFFAGFLNNDLLVSPEAGIEGAMSQAMGLMIAPGLFYGLFAFMKYGAIPAVMLEELRWEDVLLFCTFGMIITGLLTVIEWDALFPDRRDYYILTALPVPTRLLFLAKLSSVFMLLAIVWAAGNLGPALLFSAAVSNEGLFGLARTIAAHITATFCACACVVLFFIGAQGVLLNLLPPKWYRRLSLFAQLVLLILLVLSFLLLPVILYTGIPWIRAAEPWIYRLPPFWFLGLYQVLIGHGGPVFSRLAISAVEALGAVAAISALAYAVSYSRHVKKSLESVQSARSGPGRMARVLDDLLSRSMLKDPVERACFHFIRITLSRSSLHRLLVAAYLGFGLALMLVGTGAMVYQYGAAVPIPGLLSVELVLVFFVLAGMRFAFTMPAELRANWLFQATEPAGKRVCSSAAWKTMLMLGACPVLLALLPVHAFFWGFRAAAAHLCYGGTLAWLLSEVLLIAFPKIPFTCTYLPGKANVKALWSVYVTFFVGYAYGMARLESALLPRPLWFLLACVIICGASAILYRARLRSFRPGVCLTFEDLPDPAVRTLSIGASR